MIFKKNGFTVLTLIAFCIILSSCGFKPLTMTNINNISLIKLDSTGNKIINFKISNYLKQTLGYKKNNPTKISVEINSRKEKTIKEKNIKNEITKYNLTIITEIKVNVLEDNTNFSFILKKMNDYKVNDQYSKTVQNEKRATNEILNVLTQDIVKNILLKIQ
jgi:DNA primase catalytic subunit